MKFLLPLIFLLSMLDCKSIPVAQTPTIFGSWCTVILTVNVIYKFSENSEFEEITIYDNKQIGGTRGRIESIDQKFIKIHQISEFDHGVWRNSNMLYSFEYFMLVNRPNYLALSPSFSSEDLIETEKCLF